jgi:uncharacterized damage-inducible protein DinB
MHLADVRALLGHMEWADSIVWSSVLGCASAAGSGELRTRLHHVHNVQHVYLQIWRGEPIQARDAGESNGLPEIARWAADIHAEIRRFEATLNDADLGRELRFPWEETLRQHFGVARPATLAQMIQQVAMHTAHHRGQLLLQLRGFGSEPPLVDFIAWIWMGQPNADWSVLQKAPHASGSA